MANVEKENRNNLVGCIHKPRISRRNGKVHKFVNCNSSEGEWEYPDSRKQIESCVFDKIRTYRRELQKFGEVIMPVITYNGTYKVK